MASKNTQSNTNPATVDHDAAAKALSAMGEAIHGPRGAKKAAEEKAKAERRAKRVQELLKVLDTGETGKKTVPWNYREALIKAVSAAKQGATGEQLAKCKALQKVAEWSKVAEAVEVFAKAKDCPPEQLLKGLGISKATPAAPEAKAEAPKARKPRAPRSTKAKADTKAA